MIQVMEQTEILAKIKSTLHEIEIDLDRKDDISSLDLMLAALRLEKAFSIKFEIDEILPENFSSLEVIAAVIQKKRHASVG